MGYKRFDCIINRKVFIGTTFKKTIHGYSGSTSPKLFSSIEIQHVTQHSEASIQGCSPLRDPRRLELHHREPAPTRVTRLWRSAATTQGLPCSSPCGSTHLLALGTWFEDRSWRHARSWTNIVSIARARAGSSLLENPLTLPYCHPLTNSKARYACPAGSVNWKLSIASTPSGTARSNVVTKKPTPAPFGRPWEGERLVQFEVENPGRCHPARSPNKPPSLRTPRTLSG
jgi:hypothetical protein